MEITLSNGLKQKTVGKLTASVRMKVEISGNVKARLLRIRIQRLRRSSILLTRVVTPTLTPPQTAQNWNDHTFEICVDIFPHFYSSFKFLSICKKCLPRLLKPPKTATSTFLNLSIFFPSSISKI